MTRVTTLAATLVAFTAGLAAIQSRTTWDGVYTEAQARRGEEVYGQSCASCHAPDLTGIDPAPALSGKEFNADWNDMTLDDLVERVQTSMPADAPGSLKRQQYIDLVAFVLAKGGFPAGSTELPAESPALKDIKFAAQRR